MQREPRDGRAPTACIAGAARAPALIPSARAASARNRQHALREQLFNNLSFLSYILNLIFNYSNAALKAEMIHSSTGFSVTPFTVKSASETLASPFDTFALCELGGLREGLFGTKYLLALLPHSCSAPACFQLRTGRELPSPLSCRHPLEGWSQPPFPVAMAQLFPYLPMQHLPSSSSAPGVQQRLTGTKHIVVLLLVPQGRPPPLLTKGISLPKPRKRSPDAVQTAPQFAS